MKKKTKFLLLLISLTICLGVMSSTYSRYVANAKGDINASFSKWQILVNNNDITNQTNSTLILDPVIEEQEHISANVIAPSSKGYFDITIDPANVDVSFKYLIELEIENDDMPDLMITKYAIFPDSYIESDDLDITYINNNTISNSLLFNKVEENFQFQSFVVRVYFEWYDGTSETMNDESDTAVGALAVSENTKFKLNAKISFEQIID